MKNPLLLIKQLAITSLLISSMFVIAVPATILRLSEIPSPPKIDGKISPQEWDLGMSIFGGISQTTGLLAWRDITFYIAYDKENIYFAQKSELPPSTMKLVSTGEMAKDDTIEFTLREPQTEKKFSILINSKGQGNLPAGVLCVNSLKGKYWETEIAIPFRVLGLKGPTFAEWGLQVSRIYQNLREKVLLHLPSSKHPMASLILDKSALAISFVGLGKRYKSGGYEIRYSARNPNSKPVTLSCDAEFVSEGPPNIINAVRTVLCGSPQNFDMRVVAGASTGTRTLNAIFKRKSNEQILFHRVISWGHSKITWVNPNPSIRLDIGVYPSYGKIKGRVWCKNVKSLDKFSRVEFCIENETGKSIEHRTAERRSIDFFLRWKLPKLPAGKYNLVAMLISKDGKHKILKRSFEIKSFVWNGNSIGKERIIIPPFIPLQANLEGKEVHALQTGYRICNGLWDRVYAQKENILAAPITLFINGDKFTTIKDKVVSIEPDRVVAESMLKYKNLELKILHEYDYDGMCKVTFDFIPQLEVKLESLFIDIPLKTKYAKLFHSTRASIRRNLSEFIPMGKGIVWASNQGYQFRPGNFRPYLWFGEIYKGFSWFCETENNWSLTPKLAALELRRSAEAVTFRVNIINKACKRNKPFQLVMGFQPTPVKPQPKGWRKYSFATESGYVPSNSIGIVGALPERSWAGSRFGFYPLKNDYSYIKCLKEKIGRNPKEVSKFIDQYIKKFNLENTPSRRTREIFMNFGARQGKNADVIIPYFNPRGSLPQWPEYETYVDEWQCSPYRVNKRDLYYNEPVASYRDMLLYYLQAMVRNGADGVYFDNVFETASTDPDTGAIELSPGQYGFQYTIWGMRELLKRTATMLYLEKKTLLGRPLIRVHMTNSNIVPFMSFVAMTLNWEQHYGGWEYHDRFPEAYILTECLGTQTGTIPNIMVQASGDKIPWIYRTMLANIFAYDLMLYYIHQSPQLPVLIETTDLIRDFGYGNPEVTVYPGWSKKNPVKLSRRDAKATILVKKDAALLLIGDLGKGGELELDLSGLGFEKYCISNAENNMLLGNANKVKINLKKRDFALIKVENSTKQTLPEIKPIFKWAPENVNKMQKFDATPVPFKLNTNPASFTFTAWTKPENNKYNSIFGGIVSRPGFHTQLAYNYKSKRFMFSAVTQKTKNNKVYTKLVYPTGKWHFVTGVFDAVNKKMSIYIDGEEQGMISVEEPVRQYPAEAFIGCSSNLERNKIKGYFYGEIGEVSIYKKALNKLKIKEKYDLLKGNYLK